MDRLTTEELLDLQEEILARLPESITALLISLNTNGRLEEFLYLIGMGDLVDGKEPLEVWSEGRVIVFGDTQIREKDLFGVAKDMGVSKERIEFIDFNEAKRFDYKTLEYNHKVVAVMFGAVPHSTSGKGSDTSVITKMERKRDVFPKVIRLNANGTLKVTKTNFRESLKELIESGLIAV